MGHALKDQYVPLNVTQMAQHRIFVGLGWDPNTNTGISEKLGALMSGKKTDHDLDLLCFVYDADHKPLARIGAKSKQSLDGIGQIYHSGDNTQGLGDDDDEQISVELKNIDPAIHYIVFTVVIRSGHCFKDLQSPEIRLADGYSDHNFLRHALSDPVGEDAKAFVFTALRRRENRGWDYKNISAYYAQTPPNGWETALAAHL